MKPPFTIPPHLKPILDRADQMIAQGHKVHFKFTCVHCKARQMFEEVNTFSSKGDCMECGQRTELTDVKAEVNYMLIVDGPDIPMFLDSLNPRKPS